MSLELSFGGDAIVGIVGSIHSRQFNRGRARQYLKRRCVVEFDFRLCACGYHRRLYRRGIWQQTNRGREPSAAAGGRAHRCEFEAHLYLIQP